MSHLSSSSPNPSKLSPSKLSLGSVSIEGTSAAGEETWFRVQPPGLALDVGRGMPQLVAARDLFLSHGHLDHALGLPFVLSQRGMHRRAPGRVICPASIAGELRAFLEAAQALERTRYDYQLVGLSAGERVELGRGFVLEGFDTDHVVPSLGAHLFARKRRLKEAFRSLSRPELVELKGQGAEIDEETEEHLLSYCGDTGPGVFERSPGIFEAPVLMVECTFLGSDLETRGSDYGHLHWSDLVRCRDRFANRAIVLYHLSRRHRVEELRAAVDAELPELAERIYLWGEKR